MADVTFTTDNAPLNPQQANELLNQQLQDIRLGQRQLGSGSPVADANTAAPSAPAMTSDRPAAEDSHKKHDNHAGFSILTGYITHHFQQERYDGKHYYNNFNPGIGLQYNFNRDFAVVGQTYYNSVRRESFGVGIKYKTLHVGPVDLGVMAGTLNGYPAVNHGGFFPAVVPELTVNLSKRTALNFDYIPLIKTGNGAHTAESLSVQFQLKL